MFPNAPECCPGCGGNRTTEDAGPGWAIYHCNTCGISREEVVQ